MDPGTCYKAKYGGKLKTFWTFSEMDTKDNSKWLPVDEEQTNCIADVVPQPLWTDSQGFELQTNRTKVSADLVSQVSALCVTPSELTHEL